MIKVSSGGKNAGNYATITINNEEVKVHPNKDYNYRGMHIVVINKLSGKVEIAKVFDTSENSERFDAFVERGIPNGFIVVAACKDDCVKKLSH